jgi:plasmid stability protein
MSALNSSITFRVPKDLRDKVKAKAKEEGRSEGAYLRALLTAAVQPPRTRRTSSPSL